MFDSQPIPVTELSKARVCSRSLARIAGLNHVGGMYVCVLCCSKEKGTVQDNKNKETNREKVQRENQGRN